MEPDRAKHQLIGTRKASQTQEDTRQNSMMKAATHQRGKSQALKEAGANQTIDVKSYRGNLYKQTLSPSWSKTKLREAQSKYNKIAEDLRNQTDSSALSNNNGSPGKKPS